MIFKSIFHKAKIVIYKSSAETTATAHNSCAYVLMLEVYQIQRVPRDISDEFSEIDIVSHGSNVSCGNSREKYM